MDTVTLMHPRRRGRLIFIEPVLAPTDSGSYELVFQLQWVRYVPKDEDNEELKFETVHVGTFCKRWYDLRSDGWRVAKP